MAWWLVLAPAASIALCVRAIALLRPAYFSWIELLWDLGDENVQTRRTRRTVLLRRIAVPFVVGTLTALVAPRVSPAGGALIGTVAAGLLLWPMVFHGLPYGVYRRDWLLAPVYGGFVGVFSASCALGVLATESLSGRGASGPPLLSLVAQSALVAVLGGLCWWSYDAAAAALGRQAAAR